MPRHGNSTSQPGIAPATSPSQKQTLDRLSNQGLPDCSSVGVLVLPWFYLSFKNFYIIWLKVSLKWHGTNIMMSPSGIMLQSPDPVILGWLQLHPIITTTILFLSFQTDRSGQTVQTQIRLLADSVYVFLTHFSIVKPHCSNFRMITPNFSGVRIFRNFLLPFRLLALKRKKSAWHHPK